MASCQTNRWVSTAPYVRLTVTGVSEHDTKDTQAKLNWTLEYYASYAASVSSSRSYSVVINGDTVKTGTFAINGKTGWHTVASGSELVDRGTVVKTIKFSTTFEFDVTWSGSYRDELTANGTIDIIAKTSYTVKYALNGGSGTFANQTKWHGTNLKLRTAIPARDGYTFAGWKSSVNGTVYKAGGTYGVDSGTTMTAQWTANKYTVKYDLNGGSGTFADQTKTHGVALTLRTGTPTKSGYTFKCWNAKSDGSGITDFNPGGTYTGNSDITLYAIWKSGYEKPRIAKFSVNRDSSNSTTGVFSLEYACDAAISSIVVEWKLSSESAYPSANKKTVTASATSGTITGTFADGALNEDYTYDVRVTVTDATDSNFATVVLATNSKFYIDFLAGNYGVGIGKAATKKDTLEIGFAIEDKFGTKMGNGLVAYESAGIDPNTTIESLILTNHANNPMGSGNFMYIQTYFYNTKSATANRMQFAFPYKTTGSMYHRYYIDGTWSAWRRHVNADEFPMRKAVSLTGLPSGSKYNCYYDPTMNMCFLRLYVTGLTMTAGTVYTVGTIDTKYRPNARHALSVATVQNLGSVYQAWATAADESSTPGTIRLVSSVAKDTAADFYITGFWICQESAITT